MDRNNGDQQQVVSHPGALDDGQFFLGPSTDSAAQFGHRVVEDHRDVVVVGVQFRDGQFPSLWKRARSHTAPTALPRPALSQIAFVSSELLTVGILNSEDVLVTKSNPWRGLSARRIRAEQALRVVVDAVNYWGPPRSQVVRLLQALKAVVTGVAVDTPMKTVDGL